MPKGSLRNAEFTLVLVVISFRLYRCFNQHYLFLCGGVALVLFWCMLLVIVA